MEKIIENIKKLDKYFKSIGIASNFSEEVSKSVRNQLQNMDSVLEYDLFDLLIFNFEELKKELKIFNCDYKIYKTGVFLWWSTEYLHLLKFLNLFLKINGLPEILAPKRMKKVVKEFYEFRNIVQKQNFLLYQEEIKESEKFFFKKNIKPIKILLKKNPFIKFITTELTENIEKILNHYKKMIKNNIPEFTKYIENYVEEIKTHYEKSEKTLEISCERGLTPKEYQEILKEENQELDTIISQFKRKNLKLKEIIQKEKNQFLQKVQIPSGKIAELKKLADKVLNISPSQIIYKYIMLIKDTDSYNIQFTKFLYRLHHILEKNNRDYKQNQNCFYLINPKKYDNHTREKLKQFLALKFKRKYPNLSNFLIEIFKYNKYRRLETHEVPDNIKVSINGKFAYIPRIGNKPDLKMDIREIKKIINTYSFFIDALGI